LTSSILRHRRTRFISPCSTLLPPPSCFTTEFLERSPKETESSSSTRKFCPLLWYPVTWRSLPVPFFLSDSVVGGIGGLLATSKRPPLLFESDRKMRLEDPFSFVVASTHPQIAKKVTRHVLFFSLRSRITSLAPTAERDDVPFKSRSLCHLSSRSV